MIEFLSKSKNRCIKIVLVNSILITTSTNLQLFTLISYSVGVRCDRVRFFVLCPLIEKVYVEVYVWEGIFMTRFPYVLHAIYACW